MTRRKAVARTTTPVVAPERSSGERSEPERSVGATTGGRGPGVVNSRDVEVVEKAKRRRFDAAYKATILNEVDRAPPGGIGAVLRREGLYSTHLITWRRQRDEGSLAALQPKRRGPKKATPEVRRIAQLERENARLRVRLDQANTIIEFQKKVHDLLGIPLQAPPESDVTS